MTLNDLAQLAADERMIPNAQIQATRSLVIDSPPGKVWEILTNVPDWERWHPYLKNATLSGSFAAESSLVYGGLIKHRLHIAKVVQGNLAMLYGTMAGYKGITRWDIKTAGSSQTKVAFTESSSGCLIGRLYGNERLGGHLQRWLDALNDEVLRLQRR